MKNMEKRSSRVVVITGASSGIGKACYNLFKQNGDEVISLSRTNKDDEEGYIFCDVGNSEDICNAFLEIGKKYGRVDVLINNAGFGVSGALEFTNIDDIERIYRVNSMGPSICLKYALPLMQKGSRVINVSSVCAFFPLPYHALYCATKGDLNSLSTAMRMECKPLGISVTTVCPGVTNTNFTNNKVKNFKTSERYRSRIENSINKVISSKNKRMDVMKVARVIFTLSSKERSRPIVIVGGKYRFLNFLMRFLPLSLLLFFTEKLYGGYKKV